MRYPNIDLKATGERIKELRIQKNLKVEDIMEFMGFDAPQAIYKWQKGQSLPTVDNLFALSMLLGVSIDDILIPEERDEER